MSDRQDQPSRSPFYLGTEEHQSILKTSQAIDQAKGRIYTLAQKLAYEGPLSPEETLWLIDMAFVALTEVWLDVATQERITQQRQEASQRYQELLNAPVELLNAPVELPPYVPESFADWLNLPQQEGG